jgi:hypothetical protein
MKIKDEDLQMIIDFDVCRELIEKGHYFITAVPSYVAEGRTVYVFYNTPQLQRDLLNYDPSTYYPIKEACQN